MTSFKQVLRATTDRFIKHHFDVLFDGLSAQIQKAASTNELALQDLRESLQQAMDESRGAVQLTVHQAVDESRGTLQRDLDESRGAVQLTVHQAVDETRGALQQALDETRGAVQLTVHQAVDETRGALQQALDETRGAVQQALDETRGAVQLTVHQAVDETRGALQQALDETRGAVQLDLMQARDEVRGEVARFRHAFDDFRAKVEPRVVALEQRLDNLELRMLTLESEQKDYEGLRANDMADVRQEAASLRQDVRRDIVELTRMLRMQGDAADQVAEALGRTIARLSAELEALSMALEARSAVEGAPQPV